VVIDTSAIVAILTNEPERHAFNAEVARARRRLVSAGTYLESAVVIRARSGTDGLRDLRLFVAAAELSIVPFDADQAAIALDAYLRYGKGYHQAALNFGDCFSYALSRKTAEPLLFKGNDFAQTDVLRAIPPEREPRAG